MRGSRRFRAARGVEVRCSGAEPDEFCERARAQLHNTSLAHNTRKPVHAPCEPF